MKTKSLSLAYIFILSLPAVFAQRNAVHGDLQTLVEITLNTSPTMQRNTLQIDDAKANVRGALSAFDVHLASGVNANRTNLNLPGADPRSQLLNQNLITNYSDFFVSSQKRFRTGTIASVRTNYSGIADNFPLNAYNQDVGPNVADHTSSANLTITQPLLRGNGIKVNTAQLEAAKLGVVSVEQDFELNTSYEVLQTGSAYWEYLGAFKALQVYLENENRVREVLEMTQDLVKADTKQESDLVQIKADLAAQEQQTTLARQNLYNARINLGRVVGIDEELSKEIGDPADDFPTVVEPGFVNKVDLASMLSLALQHRADIKAVKNMQDALDIQLIAAKNDLLPVLDLAGFFTYGGVAAGGGISQYFNAFGNVPGRNHVVGLSLTFSFPVNNNLAKASYAKGKIALSDQQIAYEDLQRNIELNVSIAHNNLLNSVAILEKAKEALAFSEQVFSNEQVRFQNGLTTLLNLILFQERLTYAQLEYIQAMQRFAVSVIHLRFETGTLFSVATRLAGSIDKSIFYTIPSNH